MLETLTDGVNSVHGSACRRPGDGYDVLVAKALFGHLAYDPPSDARIRALASKVRDLQTECGRLAAENDRLRGELELRDTLAELTSEQLISADDVEKLTTTS